MTPPTPIPEPSQARDPSPATRTDPATTAGPTANRLERDDIEKLIARHYVGLRLLITKRVGNEEVAADLLNEALCTTWQKWQNGQIDRPEQIAGYVFQVAMFMLRNHRRALGERADLRADTSALDELASSQPDALQEIERDMAARVKELIRGMGSARDRMVLVRFYLDEEDRETICRELNMTGAQFARVLHRARARLRQLIESTGLKRSDLLSVFLAL